MKRREFLEAAVASIALVATASPSIAQSSGTTFLVCTGAWSAGVIRPAILTPKAGGSASKIDPL